METLLLDTTKIVQIYKVKERVSDYWEWRSEVKEKSYLFGLIHFEGKNAGWVDTDYLWGDSDNRYSDSDLYKKGYKIYSWEDRVTDRIVKMANVKLVFVNNFEYFRCFDTNEAMEQWVNNLKIKMKNQDLITV